MDPTDEPEVNSTEDDWITVKNYFYDTSECLGSGFYGKVYKAYDESSDCMEVALKKLPLTPEVEESLSREISVLKAIKSRYVVKFIDTFKTNNSIFIVMEYCNGGSL
jgi:serine/threonine protein kinase